ncbi:CAP domain-containing protein [Neobacillus mesonae]|uniref:CAP domain-containing protein n=1 Tax=Neobacillus mesonae TaxID=1193713 RepID=UPI002041D1F2|nr:CAP domain-containing protein [Neobacillus mesonae]MCM3568779.1 CAP domain-containing protein [Neobacillus mesonae]
MSINEVPDEKVLIKEDHTMEMNKPSSSQKPDYKPSKDNQAHAPKEGLALLIGKDVSAVKKELGEPNRIDESLYGYQWYIYNKDYKHYLQVGVEKNRVVTIFALGENLDVAPFEIGQPVEEIFNTQYIDTNINIDFNHSSYRFELNDTDLNLRPIVQLGNIYVQLYIDKFTGILSSIRFLNAETMIKQKPYELVFTGQLIKPEEPSVEQWKLIQEGTEKEIFDITNVLRSRYQQHPLLWDTGTAETAYMHSKDMSDNNDFSHNSKEFGSLTDRLGKAKVVFKSAGENIAANYTDGPAAVEGWLNSKSHRETLLSKSFTHLGVGVFKEFYTQNFIQKAEK